MRLYFPLSDPGSRGVCALWNRGRVSSPGHNGSVSTPDFDPGFDKNAECFHLQGEQIRTGHGIGENAEREREPCSLVLVSSSFSLILWLNAPMQLCTSFLVFICLVVGKHGGSFLVQTVDKYVLLS